MSNKPVSKRTRFEVFKRDGFVCQYCGDHPPAVVLHLDHINPRKNGGGNDESNLLTSCDACNLGKGAKLLSDAPPSLKSKAKDVREFEEQLRGYRHAMDAKRSRLEQETWEVAEVLVPGSSQTGFDRRWFMSVTRFVEMLGVYEVIDAANIAYSRIQRSEYQRFRYFCGVCWKKDKDAQA